MKRKAINIIFVIVFLFGLSLLLYPYISNKWNEYRQSHLITQYSESLEIQGTKIDYTEEWEAAQQYNASLYPYLLPDSFEKAAEAAQPDEAYWSCLNLNDNGIMGYIEIPKLEVKMPIYHTTGKEVMEKAAGHLEGSFLPIGGENTHAVISAHRGLPGNALFTDLDQMEIGDRFFIYVLDAVLCYEVDQIVVVDPSDIEALNLVEGEDLVTLMTCTPYGVNSHRLFVRGHRVEYEVVTAEAEVEKVETPHSFHTDYLFWVIAGLAVTAVCVVRLYRKDQIRKEEPQQTSEKEENEIKK